MSDCLKVSVLASVPIFSEVLKGESTDKIMNRMMVLLDVEWSDE